MPKAHIWSKWLLYIWAYTLNNLLTIVRTVSLKFLGNGTPTSPLTSALTRNLRILADSVREYVGIVKQALSPVHQRVDIFWSC